MKSRSANARHLGLFLLLLTVCAVFWKNSKTSETENVSTDRPASLTGSDELSVWSRDLARASKRERNELITEGVRIAERRVAALKELALTQPKSALSKTLSLDELALLPAEVREVSEQPLNTFGSIDLMRETSVDAEGSLKCIQTNVAIFGDRSLTILGADFQSPQQPMNDVPLNGYILGDVLLLDSNPVRSLTAAENEIARNSFPIGNTNAADPLTGNPADPSVAAIIGGKVYSFESVGALEAVTDTLEQSIEIAQASKTSNIVAHGYTWLEADSGAGNNGSIVEATPFQNDTIKVLFVRVDFDDLPGEPISKANLEADLATVKTRLEGYSQGVATINYTVTPTVYRLPTDASVVATTPNTAGTGNPSNDGNAIIIAETRAAAAANYTLSEYDVVAAYFPNLSSIPGSLITYGGLASVGGQNHWINGVNNFSRVYVITHEFGHNYGLRHANYFDPLREIGAISEYLDTAKVSLEYGDIYDQMGNGNTDKGYFSPYAMSRMGWLAPASLVEPNGSGTWRVYRFDTPTPDITQIRALRIPMGGDLYHWVGLRSLYASTEESAYIVGEGIFEDRPNLIDATPGSQSPENADRNDSALPVGTTFTDSTAGVSITTLAAGGTAPDTWIDVQVDFLSRLELTATSITVSESAGHAALVVSRSFDSDESCSVNYTTTGVTATSGTDFHQASGTLTWKAGDSASKTILIPIRPDAISDGGETFTLTLSSPTNAVLPTVSSAATVTILDGGQEITSFDPPFFNNSIYAIAPLPDGKVIAGGIMTSGITGNIARFNADGSEDETFLKTTGFNGTVYAITRLSDGSLLVGGAFTTYNNNATPCNRIARLNADGSLDTSFSIATGTGANSDVKAIGIESDGGIILGGRFTTFNSVGAPAIVRLLATGVPNTGSPLSPEFNSGFTPRIETLIAQDDGKIMIGGTFYFPSSPSGLRYSIARLASDGTRDPSFESGGGMLFTVGGTFIGTVNSITLTPSGQYLVGGQITSYKGQSINSRMALLDDNGDLDTDFSPATSNDNVEKVFILPDGRMLSAGRFSSPTGRIVALTSTGATDTTLDFSGGATGSIHTIASDINGDFYIGGNFFNFAGSSSRPIVKVSGAINPFALWVNSNFSAAQILAGEVGAEDDFDNDGILNITEMALGTSPTTPDPEGTFAVAQNSLSISDTGFFQASLNRSSGNIGVWLGAQFSSDLSTWSPENPTPFSNATYDVIESTGSRFTVRDKTSSGDEEKRFIRFRALLPN
ncbi:MAG: hypothetical protein NWT08_07955 [Akkermansiaceae bacterium]|nr:hypothetical protein [Akkermansiaceae bacterium]MDP4647097.1 hypothetical protein [Akkermansiaceae bacterium]MDP4780157.1 hypothetical protein [Akkermansiaceae bacterium]MDP4847143.1 hypothetical protein [Akkermansiaceae bacterium]MDP4897852.1 hypothetical protein [Akkermansiaceae bacterium]